ncbi:unnamed protein product [Caenorhabditis nigoni]
METIPEFLKSNDHHLKFCILYEVALKKPIFDSYRTFCDTVGQNAMEYPDFESWYHRFSHGELDFDYDRSMDPVPKDLMDMPVELLKKITENLDPFERSSLRSTNSDIKEVTDSLSPVFENIIIATNDDGMGMMEWKLNDKEFKCQKTHYGCTLSAITKYEGCHIRKSLEILTSLFRTPNIRINNLSLDLPEKSYEFYYLLPDQSLVKHLNVHASDEYDVVPFLSSIKPGHLESITMDFEEPWGREFYEEIFETDQFKQAKNVYMPWNVKYQVEDLVHFSHLKSFHCHMKTFYKAKKFLKIRDMIATFERFESYPAQYYHWK